MAHCGAVGKAAECKADISHVYCFVSWCSISNLILAINLGKIGESGQSVWTPNTHMGHLKKKSFGSWPFNHLGNEPVDGLFSFSLCM